MLISRVSQFLYLSQNVTDIWLFFVQIKLVIWFIRKPLYSNGKLIAFWRNACILHGTGL